MLSAVLFTNLDIYHQEIIVLQVDKFPYKHQNIMNILKFMNIIYLKKFEIHHKTKKNRRHFGPGRFDAVMGFFVFSQ